MKLLSSIHAYTEDRTLPGCDAFGWGLVARLRWGAGCLTGLRASACASGAVARAGRLVFGVGGAAGVGGGVCGVVVAAAVLS
jgi:hypothetical protein